MNVYILYHSHHVFPLQRDSPYSSNLLLKFNFNYCADVDVSMVLGNWRWNMYIFTGKVTYSEWWIWGNCWGSRNRRKIVLFRTSSYGKVTYSDWWAYRKAWFSAWSEITALRCAVSVFWCFSLCKYRWGKNRCSERLLWLLLIENRSP